MPLLTVDGIVIKNADYKENDRMLTVFTPEYGALGVSVKGCRKKGNTNIACSEIFSFCEFVLFENKGKYSVNSFSLKEAFYPLREDFDKLSCASFCCELVYLSSDHGNVKSDALFSMLYYALSYICYTDNNPVDLALCFAFRALLELGYAPSLTSCAICGGDLRQSTKAAFSSTHGGALCSKCAGGFDVHISVLSLEAVRRMMKLQDSEMRKVVLPSEVREELLPLTVEFCETVLERKLKSGKTIGKIV